LLLSLASLVHGAARAEAPASKEQACAVYSLASAGDAAYGKWVADTIPQVIEPESWTAKGSGKAVIAYHAPKRVLVVRASPAVQAKVAAFIEQLGKPRPASRLRAPCRLVDDVPHVVALPPDGERDQLSPVWRLCASA
ncbi:MAG: hypothetical protein K2W96_12350, partial [Gemmataceae bacterium]|nr:hypothetical protein [Gemmataceae bacterium]